MAYTGKEVADLSGVTVKTLYHYQRVGLLLPDSIGKNGYRYYTDKELERLQQIMFYRELDFSLGQIKIALENEPNRLICLEQQRTLLIERKERLTKNSGHIRRNDLSCAERSCHERRKNVFRL